MHIRYRGNRWYKCDFHLHTPASECFEDKSVTPEIFIDEVVKNGLECIAITDHNTVAWIDKIKNVAKDRGVTVFPGVEITCSDTKVHILVLFDLEYSTIKIEDFLIKSGIDRDLFGKQMAHSQKGIIEIAKIAQEVGALIIPAHIDDYSGVSLVSNQIRENFWKLDNINVVQMVNEELITRTEEKTDSEIQSELLAKYTGISPEEIKKFIVCDKEVKNQEKGIVTFSDNPKAPGEGKHGLWGVGQKYSYIKMCEKPSLESLRQAFLFPQYRIKNYYDEKEQKISMPRLWIKKINIKDIELLGKEELEVEFNPQLTAIIGGRGSGKSTIVRFLTGAFAKGRIKDLQEIYTEFKEFYQLKNKDVGVLRPETIITIEIVKNDILHIIQLKNFKSGGGYDVLIKKYNDENEQFEEITDVNPEDIFNVDIYNQKQIYELAKNTNALRDKIDSLITGIDDKKSEASKLVTKYKRQYAYIKDIEEKVKNKKKFELELKDLQEKIDTYKTSGINDIIDKYKLFKNQKILLHKQAKELESKVELLNNFREDLQLAKWQDSILEGGYQDELTKLINSKALQYENIANEIIDIGNKVNSLKVKFIENIRESQWYKKYGQVKIEYESRLGMLKDKGIDIEQVNFLLKSMETKQQELKDIEKYEIELIEEHKALNEIRKSYIVKREEISKMRKDYSNNLLKDTTVKIKVKKFRNMDDFIFKLRSILQKKQSFDDDIKSIVEKCYNGDIVKEIDELAKRIISIKDTEESNSIYSARFNNLIKGLNNEQISEICMLIPEDYIEIEYKPAGSKVFKSLKNASAGQRTSAILTFILSDGNTPLILDQPEDDLDNHLIYDLVVDRLKKCKENRQIIVVTHNANIPVNGDAELIIAMDSNSKYVKIFKSGGIEEDELRDEICTVMEGGEMAFSMRANRYKI